MSPQLLDGFPSIAPPGGAAVASTASAVAGPPVLFRSPPGPFAPEAPDNLLLTFVVADGVEIVEATVRLRGDDHVANLASGKALEGGRATIDLGGLRPVTRINYTQGAAGAPAKLMVQLGGVWHLPEPAGAITSFNAYPPGVPFPELIAEKVLLAPVVDVQAVESSTFPSNVTLRLTDGGVPFFFQRGSLRSEQVRVPDFGEQLALAVRGAEPVDGSDAVDLVAHSDTFGTIMLDSARVAYRMVHNALAGLDFEARTRTIPADGSASFALTLPGGLTRPEGRPPVTAVTLSLVAVGFGPTFAPAVVHHGAVVSAEFVVAQAVDVADALTTTTLNLFLLRRTPKATLVVELREDIDGEPRGAVLASASTVADALPDGQFGWLALTLPAPLAIEAGTRVWIALRADSGEVEWGGDVAPPGGNAAQFSADRGNTFQPHPMTAAFLFVQALPNPDLPLTLRILAGGQEQSIPYDPSAFPLALDAASPLVSGINAALAAASDLGAPLVGPIQLTLSADPPLPIQLTLTQLDVTFAQTLAACSTLSSGNSGITLSQSGLQSQPVLQAGLGRAGSLRMGGVQAGGALLLSEQPDPIQAGR